MYYYIINPTCGEGISKTEPQLKSYLKELGIAGEFVKMMDRNDAAKLARIGVSNKYNTIVAIGDDATVKGVMEGIADENIALGIIPFGKSNELARGAGVSDWRTACKTLAARKTEFVNLGEINKKHFILSCALGFGINLQENAAIAKQSIFKKPLTFTKILKEAIAFKPFQAQLIINDEFTVISDCFAAFVGMNESYNFWGTKSDITDNKLDLFLFGKSSKREIFNFLNNFYFKKSSSRYSNFSAFRAKSIKIQTQKPETILVDREYQTQTSAEITISSRKIRFIVGRERLF